MKTTLQLAFIITLSFSSKLLIAQTAFSSNSLKQLTTISPSPQQISASDGTYSKYILIKWMSPGSAKSFEVFKSSDNNIEHAALLNKKNAGEFLVT